MIALMVALGAAVGAPSRYLVDQFVQRRNRTAVPFGTLAVNLAGSTVLGLLLGLSTAGTIGSQLMAAAGTGLCGAFTTYSTFGFETVQLLRRERPWTAAGYVAVSVVGGLLLVWIGVEIATATQ